MSDQKVKGGSGAIPNVRQASKSTVVSCPEPAQLTGLARLEAHMASRYGERADGWPVGPELHGYRAWSCTSPTVQLVEMPVTRCAERFVVLTLFPFLRIDRRYPPSDPMRLHAARRYAFARLRTLSPDGEIICSKRPGIELCRGGDHFGLEVPL